MNRDPWLNKKAAQVCAAFFYGPGLFVYLFAGCGDIRSGPVTMTEAILGKRDSIIISLPYGYKTHASLGIQAYSRNDSSFIMISDIDKSSLLEINTQAGVLNKIIPVKRIENDTYPVFLFHYISPDSILILRDVTNINGARHDSIFFMINDRGEEIGFYDLSSSPFPHMGDKPDSSFAAWYHQFEPLSSHNGRVFITPYPYLTTNQVEKVRQRYGIPTLAYFDIIGENKGFHEVPFKSPDPKLGYYALEQSTISTCPLSLNSVIVSYHNDRDLYKVNVLTGQVHNLSNDYYLIDAPTPYAPEDIDHYNPPSYNPHSSVFRSLLYNRDKGEIIRFATMPAPKELARADLRHFRHDKQSIGVYDTNLRLLAEGIKPKWFESSSPAPIYHNGRIISIKKASEGTSELKVYFSELEMKPVGPDRISNMKHYLNTVDIQSDQNLNDYLSTVHVPKDSYILLVPQAGCPSCIEGSISHYLSNRDELMEKGVYLVVCGERYSGELKELKSRYIIVDDANLIENYLNAGVTNPALIAWNGKSVKRMLIMEPKNMRNIDKIIEDFTKKDL